MKQLKFTKMHGLGNNYIYVNCFEEKLSEEELPGLAVQVSRMDTGIGSDGMILICPSSSADFNMRVFNNDGSEAKNCGNGLRCVARYVYDRGLTDKTEFTIETLGGIVFAKINPMTGGKVESITIDMGVPRLSKKEIPMQGEAEEQAINETHFFDEEQFELTAVSMGNPHAVIFADDVEGVEVERIGKKIEWAPLFPERVNVEFISIQKENEIDFRVWERGSGITQACGTGACAAVVAAVLNGKVKRETPVTVHLLGGDLVIVWDQNDHVYMTGPASFIADGVFYY